MKLLLTVITCLLTVMPCYAKGSSSVHAVKATHLVGKRYGNKVNEGSYVLKYQVERFKPFKPATNSKTKGN